MLRSAQSTFIDDNGINNQPGHLDTCQLFTSCESSLFSVDMSPEMYDKIMNDRFVKTLNMADQLPAQDMVDGPTDQDYVELEKCGQCAVGDVHVIQLTDSGQEAALKKTWFTAEEDEVSYSRLDVMLGDKLPR